jgi:hypothetical protein
MIPVARFVSEVKKGLQEDLEARRFAQVEGLRLAARGLELDLEAATQSAGLGRLSKAWGSQAYPRKGHGSLSAAAEVFVKGTRHTQDAMWAFANGATIRSKNGLFLLIPTKNAPKQGLRASRDEKAFGRYGRDKVLAAAEARYGRLRFVYRRRGPSLLVADNVRARAGKRGGFAKASAKAISKGNTATIVVFILVPIAHLRKRFDIQSLEARWRSRIPLLISSQYRAFQRS